MKHRMTVAALMTAAAFGMDVDPLEAIKVPVGNKCGALVFAVGEQAYTCDAEGSKWGGAVPTAALFDSKGLQIGTHGKTAAGPYWQTLDGKSRVEAAPEATMKSMNPAALLFPQTEQKFETVAWVRLKATKSTSDYGPFSRVTFIQRINTAGGEKPADGCKGGEVLRVPYTAMYQMWTASK